MTRYLVSIFLLFLCFIMPVQIYTIGDGIGAGVQGAFFRYQESSYGTNLITIIQEVQYVTSGIYEGRTALSVFIWVMGDIMLVIATILALTLDREPDKRRFATICVSLILSGIYFLISAQLQYGLLLHGAAGIAIPFGVILMIWTGWFFYTKKDILFINILTLI